MEKLSKYHREEKHTLTKFRELCEYNMYKEHEHWRSGQTKQTLGCLFATEGRVPIMCKCPTASVIHLVGNLEKKILLFIIYTLSHYKRAHHYWKAMGLFWKQWVSGPWPITRSITSAWDVQRCGYSTHTQMWMLCIWWMTIGWYRLDSDVDSNDDVW